MRKYQRLTSEKRQALEVLHKQGKKQQEIADYLNVHQSTISRELKRHSKQRIYNGTEAQLCCNAKRTAKRRRKVLTASMLKKLTKSLKRGWSPEQIAGRLKREGYSISCDSIYRMVREDREAGGSLYLFLRRKGKPYRKRGYRSSGRGLIPNRTPIKERPQEVETKATLGHWEVDTIVSRGRKGGFLTVVERKTKYCLVFPLQTRRAEEILEKLKSVKRRKHFFESLTFDNGKEFAKHEDISRVLRAKCFFADPYCSWQRGLNEHTNGLIREFYPKKQYLGKIGIAATRKLEKKLNNRPRKVLNFQTPQEALNEALKSDKILCNG